MPGTRIAFHVGAHKTGTSLVQHYMRDNVGLLYRNHVQYLGRGALNDLIGWGPALLENPEPLRAKVRAARRNPWVRTLVASHENTIGRPFQRTRTRLLYPDAARHLDALAAALGPAGGRVVLSVRPQHEFVESYYLQTVHVGKHHSFRDWLAGVDLDAISWFPLVDACGSAFGRENVDILDFRLIREGQDAYLRHFFELAAPSLHLPFRYAQTSNPSISEKGLAIALAANPHLNNGPERKRLRIFLQTHFSNIDYPRPALLSEDQRAWLRERYDDEYEALVRR